MPRFVDDLQARWRRPVMAGVAGASQCGWCPEPLDSHCGRCEACPPVAGQEWEHMSECPIGRRERSEVAARADRQVLRYVIGAWVVIVAVVVTMAAVSDRGPVVWVVLIPIAVMSACIEATRRMIR